MLKSLRLAAAAALVLGPLSTQAQTTIVYPGDLADWAIFPTGPVPVDFNTDQASIGSGSLAFGPVSSTPADKFLMAPPYGTAGFLTSAIPDTLRSAFSSISYDFFPAALSADNFYLNVYVDQDGDGPAASFYDCRYDYVPTGTTGAWNTFTIAAATTPTAVVATGSTVCAPTLAGGNAGDQILYMVINGGQSNATDAGLAGHWDNVRLSAGGLALTFDFEAALPPPSGPTPPPAAAKPIPALPLWGMFALVLGMLAIGRSGLRRKP